ncbi:MAG: Rieske 2Fe-2S domain-containing protein [Flavobacteriales bacterium]|nr:Rieske 2Fe-2S domain-containing protein [Flavobacteriales bacterium]
MDRRRFLRTSCQACAALAIIPVAASLEGCASTSKLAITDGVLTMPLDNLRKDGSAIVKADGLSNKLMISKRADGSFSAVELNCPHKNGPLKEKGGQLVCDWHGSAFELDGKLLKGPSKSGLKSYPVEAEGTMLRVRVG